MRLQIPILLLLLLKSTATFGQFGFRSPQFIAQLNKTSNASTSPVPDILWWKLNDGIGTSVTGDGSAGGDDGTTDADWTTGVAAGGALAFNGSSDDAFSASTVVYGTNIVTVTFWLSGFATNATKLIAESNTDWNSGSHNFLISLETYGLFAGVKGTGNYRGEYTSVVTNTMTHFVVVIDNSTTAGDIKIFINGSEATTTTSLNTKAGSGNIATAELNVGARNSSSLWYAGNLDDLRIYSGDRSADAGTIYSDPK